MSSSPALAQDLILEVLQAYLELPETPSLDSRISSDLGADDLDLVEVLWELETRFDISIPEAALRRAVTVGDLAALVERLQKEASHAA